jgi:hypothetical protein
LQNGKSDSFILHSIASTCPVYPTIIDKVNSKEIPSSDRFRNIMLLNIP